MVFLQSQTNTGPPSATTMLHTPPPSASSSHSDRSFSSSATAGSQASASPASASSDARQPPPVSIPYPSISQAVRSSMRRGNQPPHVSPIPNVLRPGPTHGQTFTGLNTSYSLNLNTSRANQGRVASAEAHLPQHNGGGPARRGRARTRAIIGRPPSLPNPRKIESVIYHVDEVPHGRFEMVIIPSTVRSLVSNVTTLTNTPLLDRGDARDFSL